MHTTVWPKNLKGKEHLGLAIVDWKNRLMRALKNNVTLFVGFIWLRIGSGGGVCEHENNVSDIINICGNVYTSRTVY
jgi:hypothetical protein